MRLGARLSDNLETMTTDIEWLEANKDRLSKAVFSHTRGFDHHWRTLTFPVSSRVAKGKFELWKAQNAVRTLAQMLWQSTFPGPK
jgi:hypothetical protein